MLFYVSRAHFVKTGGHKIFLKLFLSLRYNWDLQLLDFYGQPILFRSTYHDRRHNKLPSRKRSKRVVEGKEPIILLR